MDDLGDLRWDLSVAQSGGRITKTHVNKKLRVYQAEKIIDSWAIVESFTKGKWNFVNYEVTRGDEVARISFKYFVL